MNPEKRHAQNFPGYSRSQSNPGRSRGSTKGQRSRRYVSISPISIKRRGNGWYVPRAQQERILNRHILGESIRKISREEHRDFRTVAKVLRNNPAKLREHLEICRAQFYALLPRALETISRALENGNTRLAQDAG